MLLDDLDQALQASCWGTAEAGPIEVIARALDVSEATVERILYAASVVLEGPTNYDTLPWNKNCPWVDGPALYAELRQGIDLAINEGMARVRVRRALEAQQDMYITTSHLITTAAEVCVGCPHSLECSAQSYSDPVQCYTLGPASLDHTSKKGVVRRPPFGMVLVRPLRIIDNTVTVQCKHPRGTYKVTAKDLKTCHVRFDNI